MSQENQHSVDVAPDLNEIHIHGEVRRVSPQLIKLLQLFLAHEGRVLTRSKILDRIWGTDSASDENLTQAVSRLRAALRTPGQSFRYIKTVPKVGYVFSLPEISEEATPNETESFPLDQYEVPNLSLPALDHPRRMNAALAAFCVAAIYLVFLFSSLPGEKEVVIDYKVEVEVTAVDERSGQSATQSQSHSDS